MQIYSSNRLYAIRLHTLIQCAVLLIFLASRVNSSAKALVEIGAEWSYLPVSRLGGETPRGWTALSFNDDTWSRGISGFSALTVGYYREATLLTGAEFQSPDFDVVLFRSYFQLESLEEVSWLTLRVDYNDAFVAFLNGVEVARRNLPGTVGSPLQEDVRPLLSHSAGVAEEIDLTHARSLLRLGTNVLAIQLLNADPNWPDLVLVPELLANFTRGPFLGHVLQTRAVISWRTPAACEAQVEFGTTTGMQEIMRSTGTNTIHAITLTNLLPNTVYYYRVRNNLPTGSTILGEIHQFRTLSNNGNSSFAVIGDSGQGSVAQHQIAKVIGSIHPDFLLHTGDVIYPSFTAGRADQRLFSVYRDLLSRFPLFPTIGNHDVYSGVGYYLDAFFLPTNNVPINLFQNDISPEHYYSFDHGDLHIAVLYQPITSQYLLKPGDPQYNWLINDLSTSTKKWKVLVFHMPLRTSSVHRFDNYNINGIYDRFEVEEAVLPIAVKYGVQLILNGHDHAFERFVPIHGVHCVVSGGGGGIPYGLSERDSLSSQFRYGYHCLQVNTFEDTMRIRVINQDAREVDSMAIHLKSDQSNSITKVAAWNHPNDLDVLGPPNGDGNRVGQIQTISFPEIPTVTGRFSSLGSFSLQNDSTNLYVGFSGAMLAQGQSIYLFFGTNGSTGKFSLKGIGDGVISTKAAEVEGLDFLENLSFEHFKPRIAVIAGDELADMSIRDFQRVGDPLPSGQGIFILDHRFSELAGAQLEQFNAGPSEPFILPVDRTYASTESNADFIQVTIPLKELGWQAGTKIGVAAVVGLPLVNTNYFQQSRLIDSAFLGEELKFETSTSSVLNVISNVTIRPIYFDLAPLVDSDGDNLADSFEIRIGTNPGMPDTDQDGLPDGWERKYARDPLVGFGDHGPNGDPDGDGFSNFSEFVAQTDPRSASSKLSIQVRKLSRDRIEITWATRPGLKYQLESSSEVGGEYTKVVDEISRFAVESNASVEFVLPSEGGTRYYRMRVVR